MKVDKGRVDFVITRESISCFPMGISKSTMAHGSIAVSVRLRWGERRVSASEAGNPPLRLKDEALASAGASKKAAALVKPRMLG